jgi:hypothetical protein
LLQYLPKKNPNGRLYFMNRETNIPGQKENTENKLGAFLVKTFKIYSSNNV